MNLSQIVPDFLIAKEIEEGCSPLTIRAYRHDLSHFQRLIGDLSVISIQKFHIRKYLRALHEKGYTKRGISRKIACLKSFFKFCEENELVTKNPAKVIKSPKIHAEEALPKFLTEDEIHEVLANLENVNTTCFDTKSRPFLVVRLMYASMARVSEICGLKISDVDLDQKVIRVRGKGNKQRFIPIDSGTAEMLSDHIENRKLLTPDVNAPLFVNTRNRPLTPRVIQKDLQNLRQQIPAIHSKKFTPHVLRHTGATHLRQHGMDLSELQDILGHSNPNTTRIYAKNDISHLKSSYLENHPLEE